MGYIVRQLRIHGGLPAHAAVALGGGVENIFQIKMDDAADRLNGETTQTVGFQVIDYKRDPASGLFVLDFGVFDDLPLVTVALNAIFEQQTPIEGTILSPLPGPVPQVQTDAKGRFSCVVTNSVGSETNYFGCGNGVVFGACLLDCGDPQSFDSVSWAQAA